MLRTKLPALGLALLLLGLAAALPAADAARACLPKERGPVCVSNDHGCASVSYVPNSDLAAGAGACTWGSLDPADAGLCHSARAGYVTSGGFRGVAAEVCLVQTADGAVCVHPYAQVDRDPTVLDPLCLA